MEVYVVPPAVSSSISMNLTLIPQYIPEKVPVIGVPFPISRFASPNALVVVI